MGAQEGLLDEEMVARRLEMGHSLAAGGHLGAPSAARAAKVAAKVKTAQASPQRRVLARALSMGACGAAGATGKGSDSPTSPRGFPESPEGSPLGGAPLPMRALSGKAARHEANEANGVCNSLAVAVEGNIGVGKSTLLDVVSGNPDLERAAIICEEPIQEWQDVGGRGEHNLLDAFYSNPRGHAYMFQNYAFLTRFIQHHTAAQEALEGQFRLLERSVFTDRFVFARTCAEQGLMTPLEWNVYLSWFQPVVDALPDLVPSVFVYLRASPETCAGRMASRGRSEETGVELEYLKLLHNRHEEWFIQRSRPAEVDEDGELHSTGAVGAAVPEDGPTVFLRRLHGETTMPCLDGVPVVVVNCEEHRDDVDLDAYSGDHLVNYLQKLKLYTPSCCDPEA